MTSEEAQQALDVVLGMFIASSHPATILFDSGASHSFISSSFVAILPMFVLENPFDSSNIHITRGLN
jgi:hypothetical protein